VPSSYYSPPQAPPPPGYGPAHIPIGYPTPYYPPNYPPMPAPSRSRSNRTLAIVLGVIGAVALVGCAAGTLLVISVFNAASNFVGPIAAVTQFCQDEENQDYTAAYQLLSSNVRQNYSEDQFITFSQSRDSTDGDVTACQVTSGNTPQITGSTATLSLTDTLDASQVVGPVTLVKESGQWYLDSADSSLRLF
jgi:hypothetical protein